MDFELVDNKDYLPEFRKYLSFYLRGKVEYQHSNPKTGQHSFNSILHFNNYIVDDSIYFFKNEGFYYFGLGREINHIVGLNAHTKIVAHLNYNIKVKDAFHFAKNEFNKIFLLMPINCESLSDREIFSLKDKNDIIVIDNEEYINFGELKRDIYILRNIRNFMDHISVDTQYTKFLKLKKVGIIKKYSKDPNFCFSCDNLISKSYENNEIIKDLVGYNPDICADCYSKKLMDYFLSIATDVFLKKEYLEILAENSLDVKFYLNLFDKYNMFDENGFLSKTSTNSSFVPPKFQIHSLFLETMQSYHELINEKTKINKGEELSDFELTLLRNNLSISEGLKIKKQLEHDILSGKIKLMRGKNQIKIEKIIKKIIDKKSESKKNAIEIFEIIEILNSFTINSKGELSEDFKKYITSFGLDETVCWIIRDDLKNKIENRTINKNDLLISFKRLCSEIIQEQLDKKYIKKEVYIFKNSLYLKTILKKIEVMAFINGLNSIKDNMEIDNFNLFNLNKGYFKIILDFKVTKMDVLNDFLNDFGFNIKILHGEEEEVD